MCSPCNPPKPQLGNRRRRIRQEPGLERRIRPSPRHDPRPVHWAEVGLIRPDDLVKRVLGDVALLDQQLLEIFDALFQDGISPRRSAAVST